MGPKMGLIHHWPWTFCVDRQTWLKTMLFLVLRGRIQGRHQQWAKWVMWASGSYFDKSHTRNKLSMPDPATTPAWYAGLAANFSKLSTGSVKRVIVMNAIRLPEYVAIIVIDTIQKQDINVLDGSFWGVWWLPEIKNDRNTQLKIITDWNPCTCICAVLLLWTYLCFEFEYPM